MAFADSIRTKDYTREELADLIESMLPYSQQFQQVSTLSTTTTTSPGVQVSGSGLTVTTEADDELDISFFMNVSPGTAGNTIFGRLYDGSSVLHTGQLRLWTADTNGTQGIIAFRTIFKPGAATKTYSMYWSTVAGTGYSGSQRLTVTRRKAV